MGLPDRKALINTLQKLVKNGTIIAIITNTIARMLSAIAYASSDFISRRVIGSVLILSMINYFS